MENLSNGKAHRAASTMASAAILLLSGVSSANSTEINHLNKHPPSSRQIEDIVVTGISPNFEDRWNGQDREFTVNSEGAIRPTTDDGSEAQNAHFVRQFGYISSAPKGGDYHSVEPRPKELASEFPIHIGAPLSSSDPADLPRCGPSPLKPDDVKAMVVDAARRNGVDPLFATAIAWTESGFDRTRNSPKGARGPMQLMPATAARFGVSDACDPAQNIEGGVKYLRVLLDQFQNPLLAAAAYNSGEQRIYDYGGVPPFTETVSYVAKVVNYQIGLHMPSAERRVSAADKPTSIDAGDDSNTGVIAAKKTGTFVGGVMHF